MLTKSLDNSLPGVILFEPGKYEDNRGFFMELYKNKSYANSGLEANFVQDNYSHSRKNVIRGLHYQLNNPQGKLVFVLNGEIFDVCVDIRLNSPHFGKWIGLNLSSDNRRQLFIPEGFAHGFCVLSETADVIYKCTDYYAPEDEYGINWSDPNISIDWPISDPVISQKDRSYKYLNEISREHLPEYHA
jgi:dTDP-4-dehydrorhamnose 3,5-epimerase